jgi:hypothetical protein
VWAGRGLDHLGSEPLIPAVKGGPPCGPHGLPVGVFARPGTKNPDLLGITLRKRAPKPKSFQRQTIVLAS